MLNNKKAFTLLEGIIAIFLITIGIGGAYTLISQTISSANIASQKLIAAYLAQEGLEIVKNIRDSNWLVQRGNPAISWNSGLTGCGGGCEADYKTGTPQQETPLRSYTGTPLNIDVNDFYSYSAGSPTMFKRKITISSGPVLDDSLNIKVEVQWQERGRTNSLEVQEILYNWRK